MEKKHDLLKYYDRIKLLCCFETISSTERQNILLMPIALNRVLKPEYRIVTSEATAFVNCYKEYRNWLLAQYINPRVSFQQKYTDCFSLKNKKHWEAKKFEDLYGAMSEEKLLFAQTFSDFSTICNDPFRAEAPSNLLLKMRLGALCMLQVIGYDYEFEISEIEKKLSPEKKTETIIPSEGGKVEKVLRTAANGMQVWVPLDKLEAWERAQADKSPEAKARRDEMAKRVLQKLHELSKENKNNQNAD